MSKAQELFESFAKPGKPEWKKVASAEISGANPSENLRWETDDKQDFEAYYAPEDVGDKSYLQKFQLNGISHVSPDGRVWSNMPEVSISDEKSANALALDHLSHEAEGILFTNDKTKLDFSQLLNDIAWEHCSVSFRLTGTFPLSDLINYVSEKNYSYNKLQGCLFWQDKVSLPPALPSSNGFRFAGIVIQSSTPVEEVAQALSTGVETIEAFLTAGYKTNEILKHIAFSIPVGPKLLLEVSKLKALRMLWYQVLQAYGLKDAKVSDLYIHALSEKWVNEKFQPHGNMLKSTVASIAAISGGANAITIQPEDSAHIMMNRIARNTSIILKEESHLAKVSDPFAGAYGIAVLTDRIARDAWQKFQAKQ